MSDYLSKNLVYLRESKGETQAETATALGLTRSTYANYEINANQPKADVLSKILGHFNVTFEQIMSDNLSSVHLIAKNGNREKEEIVHPNVHGSVHPKGQNEGFLLQEPAEELQPVLKAKERKPYPATAPKVITIDSAGHENVLYVPVKARAGYLSGMADPKYIQSLPAYGLPGYHNGTYRIFEINGPSMFPTFQDKDRCVTRWSEVSDIRDDRVYVVVTSNDGILIKRCINRMQEGKIICKSDNNFSGEYPPIVLEVSEILEVWYVVERWTRQMPGPGEIYKRIVNLEAAVTLLTHRLDHPR